MRGRNSVQQGHGPLSLALERLVDERARDTVQEEGLVSGSRADRIWIPIDGNQIIVSKIT